jgi:hypothetical protein
MQEIFYFHPGSLSISGVIDATGNEGSEEPSLSLKIYASSLQ